MRLIEMIRMAMMADESSPDSELALGLLSLFPPTIRASLVGDDEFREHFGFVAEAVVSFDQSGLHFARSNLFRAVRDVIDGKANQVTIDTKDGVQWTMEKGATGLRISRDGRQIALPDFSYLSAEADVRLAWFDKESDRFHLQDSSWNKWR